MDTEQTPDMPINTKPADEAEVSDEELRQLEKERQERLDPANRPANAEVDNTTREWIPEEEDFKDNLEGNPPDFDQGDGAGRERDPEIWERVKDQTG